MPVMVTKISDSFQGKYEVDEKTGCWLWTASLAGKGYGQIRIPGTRRNAYAHRLSYELGKGPIPKGMQVCHECDTPRCVNPEHLFLGTQKDNLTDMADKKRHLFGERNAKAKLTEEQVHGIHEMRVSGESQASIAARYGVGQMTVCRILSGERWKHVFLARAAKG